MIDQPADHLSATPRGQPRTGHRGRRSLTVLSAIIVAAALVGLAALVLWRLAGPAPGPATAAAPPRFEEVAAAAGLVHAYEGDFTYFVGGGVAAFDCDDDRRSDLYLAGGEAPAALFRNRTEAGGDLRFERSDDPVTALPGVTGAYPLDLDGDGRMDLVVLRLGGNEILRGLGDCRFERANETLGIDGGDGWTTAFSATWEAPDATLPTLAFGDYVVLDDRSQATDRCADNELIRPAPTGLRYDRPMTLEPGWCALSMLFSDWDRSGRRDLRITNDRHYYRDGEEQLWRVEPDADPRLYGRADGWARMQIWGMGIASADITGDGYPEVFLTSQGDNKLQTLADGADRPVYEDIALRRGATAHRPYVGGDILPSTAWHPEFADVNNDGFLDLFVTKGNVEAQPDHATKDPSNLLIGQPDGSFVEGAEAAGLVDFEKARGAALVDLDLDGLLDLVKVVRGANVELYRNLGGGGSAAPEPMGSWLAIDLEQDVPNRDAIGAWVTVRSGDRAIQREVTVGGGHASGQSGWLHVGLGAARSAEIQVAWPDGEVGPWLPVEADRFVTVRRGAPDVDVWVP